MEKLKHIFRPGGENDDSVMYGTPESRNAHGEQKEEPAHLTTDPGAEKKDHGIRSQIFNPGGHKYDEQRYGTTAHADKPLNDPTTGTESPADMNTGHIESEPAAKEKHGVSRQVFNPDGNKYDPERYEETGKEYPDDGPGTAGGVAGQALPDQTTQDTGAEESHLGRDAALGGAAAAGVGAAGYETGKYSTDPSKTHASQIEEPAAGTQTERAFPLGGGVTNHPATGSASTTSAQPTSRAANPYSTTGEIDRPSTTASSQPDYGRDAAIAGGAGAAAVGAGALAHEANKPRDDGLQATHANMSEPLGGASTAGNTSSQTYPDPVTSARTAHPGNDLTIPSAPSQSADPYSSFGTTQQPSTGDESHLGRDAALVGAGAAGAGALGYEASQSRGVDTDPYTSPRESQQPGTGDDSHLGRDAALAGAGAAGIGALGHEASKPDSDTAQATSLDRAYKGIGHHEHEAPAEGYVHHTKGPHALDAANRLDPHVPGEFPDEFGEDPHKHQFERDAGFAGAGAGAAGLGAAGYEASKPHEQLSTDPTAESLPSGTSQRSGQEYPIMTTTNTMQRTPSISQADQPSQPEHHYGRDAAIAGGVGAAGLGAYELTKDEVPAAAQRDQPMQPQTGDIRDTPLGGSTTAPATGAYDGTRDQAPTTAQPEPIGQQQQQQHHYGRDAAVAGGAGALAGAGVYEASRDRGDTGPASSTIGPHETNVANIVDPRVQPQPQKMHDSTTTGPYKSDMANKMDPRVDSNTTQTQEKEHHYGRDAAIAGGAGAAGLGAYEATKDRDDTGPASKTIGPHDSNVANIVDPRVQPQKEKMKDPVTTGPHKSDMANKADPRVKADPAETPEQEQHHYGRDAAIAGGAGAVGLGAYEASKDHDKDAAAASAQQAEPIKHEHNKLHKKNDPRGHPDDPRGHPVYATSGADDKHAKDLEKAREEEAKKGGDRGEKKEGLLHRILHPGHNKDKKEDKHADERTAAPSHHYQQQPTQGLDQAQRQSRHIGTDGPIGDDSRVSGHPHPIAGNDQYKIEPHTGLPMNVGKYGEGAGGTDGAQQIEGYHETDPAVQQAAHGTAEQGRHVGEEGTVGPDWEKIRKANTPY